METGLDFWRWALEPNQVTDSSPASGARSEVGDPQFTGLWADRITAVLASVTVIGGWIDGFAHTNLEIPETFFTPWHAVLYTGFLSTIVWLARSYQRDVHKPSYRMGLIGAAVFLVGGVSDLGWHEVFGIEEGIDALTSPSHLMLFLGALLMIGVPVRSAWAQTGDRLTWGHWHVLLALGFAATLAASITSFGNPFVGRELAFSYDYVDNWLSLVGHRAALTAVMTMSLILFATTLTLVLRWQLPVGALSAVLVLPVGLSTALLPVRFMPLVSPEGWYLVLLVAGVLQIEVLNKALKPQIDNGRLAAFALMAPVVFWGYYLVGVDRARGLDSSPELWGGSVMWAVIISLGLATLIKGFVKGTRPQA